jgi:hypothetical protein
MVFSVFIEAAFFAAIIAATAEASAYDISCSGRPNRRGNGCL